jgi:hypothetical protein
MQLPSTDQISSHFLAAPTAPFKLKKILSGLRMMPNAYLISH